MATAEIERRWQWKPPPQLTAPRDGSRALAAYKKVAEIGGCEKAYQAEFMVRGGAVHIEPCTQVRRLTPRNNPRPRPRPQIGTILEHGNGVRRVDTTAQPHTHAANASSPKTQVEVDFVEAAKWYKQTATRQSSAAREVQTAVLSHTPHRHTYSMPCPPQQAMCSLAHLYRRGNGVSSSYRAARALLQHSKTLGCEAAPMYAGGRGAGLPRFVSLTKAPPPRPRPPPKPRQPRPSLAPLPLPPPPALRANLAPAPPPPHATSRTAIPPLSNLDAHTEEFSILDVRVKVVGAPEMAFPATGVAHDFHWQAPPADHRL